MPIPSGSSGPILFKAGDTIVLAMTWPLFVLKLTKSYSLWKGKRKSFFYYTGECVAVYIHTRALTKGEVAEVIPCTRPRCNAWQGFTITRKFCPKNTSDAGITCRMGGFDWDTPISFHEAYRGRYSLSSIMKKRVLPLNPFGEAFFVATKKACTDAGSWLWGLAVKVMRAKDSPTGMLSQLTVASTRTSGLLGEMLPVLGVSFNQVALVVAVNVNGEGPPAPTSMNRLLNGTKLSRVNIGGGQLNCAAHWFGLSPGLKSGWINAHWTETILILTMFLSYLLAKYA